jgi:hypothetical protein
MSIIYLRYLAITLLLSTKLQGIVREHTIPIIITTNQPYDKIVLRTLYKHNEIMSNDNDENNVTLFQQHYQH